MEQEQVFLANNKKMSVKKRPFRMRSVVLLAVFFLLLLCILLVFVLPGFYLEDIIIHGAREVNEEEILLTAQMNNGDHLISHLGGNLFSIVRLRNGAIETELKENYVYIKDADVKIEYPSTVIIEIEERRKMAYLEVSDGFAIIDLEGYVLEIERGAPPEGIPLMRGLSVESATLGTQIVFVQRYGFDQNLIVLSSIVSADAQYSQSEESLMSYVRSIRYVEGGVSFLSIELPSSQRTIHVKIGSLSHINEDMNWLRHAVLSGVFEDATGSLLDMTGSDHTLR